MRPRIPALAPVAVWLTFGSAAAIVLSIAASQVLLGAAFIALLLSGEPLRLPRIKLPLAIFIAGTLLAWLASGDLKTGLPQIKKLIVFFELLIVYSCLRSIPLVRKLMLTWAALGTFTACFGFVQFGEKVAQAHRLGRDFYNFYVAARIKGFTSHWNTFSAEEMFVLLMLAAFLFFSSKSRRQWLWMLCAALLSISVVLIETRGVWLALAAAMAYLIWRWRRWVVLMIPVVAVLVFVASPAAIRERFQSIVHSKDVDSNEFHVVVWRTGLRMIESHPLLGLGPEQQHVQFDRYMPTDIHQKPIGFYGHLHNLYLEYAAERGIPVLLVFLWMIAWILLDFIRGLRALPPGPGDRRFILEGAIAVVIGALVEGFFEVNLGDSEPLTMFLIAVACGYLALDPALERLPVPGMFRVGVESNG
ncbi:MAG: O-antigen ligase family protein [Bryobacteraceae bacterium]